MIPVAIIIVFVAVAAGEIVKNTPFLHAMVGGNYSVLAVFIGTLTSCVMCAAAFATFAEAGYLTRKVWDKTEGFFLTARRGWFLAGVFVGAGIALGLREGLPVLYRYIRWILSC